MPTANSSTFQHSRAAHFHYTAARPFCFCCNNTVKELTLYLFGGLRNTPLVPRKPCRPSFTQLQIHVDFLFHMHKLKNKKGLEIFYIEDWSRLPIRL